MTLQQNNLSLLNFKFKLDMTPEIEFRVQKISIPSFNLGHATVPTPFVKMPLPGNISYGDLAVTFMVGENMADYLEIYDWMVKLGYPDQFGQYRDIKSDCSVIVLNSSLRPNINIRFTDAFPINLTPIDFDLTLPEVQYATCTATFKFVRWYVEPF